MTADQRIGRVVGLVVFWSTMAAVAGILLWPKVVGSIVGMVTWTDADKDACAETAGCAVNLVQGGVVSVWWAFAWIALIIGGIAICWAPARWWTSKGRFALEAVADSSPQWLRVHAIAALFVCLIVGIPGRSITTTWAPEYFAAAAAALAGAGLATLSLRHARRTLSAREYERLVGHGVFADRARRGAQRRERRGRKASE
ncbi:hypothetical protein [Microbacterium ulmi]|uniref:Uncharacterized protein n=1 Tax=Microbacterium ulmi TaxID=179095 RepID=A0A7Y2M1N4_9MICO|nr:hypothetical protein [Microbacterium ulmi]NII70104.1 hypothetical protein [Microbacterium ulmi]NNH04354.1 hypothetical protein [Microbacterium ulmi]